MSLPTKRIVAARCDDRRIRLIEQDVPPLAPGAVLVRVRASLVSPGTELGGWAGFSARPQEPASQTEPRPFGYSNAGVVMAVGEGAEEFAPGDRVGCIGGNYAMHTDYAVVPHHLCVALPTEVDFAQGCYAMLTATALHAVRRGEPTLGESAVVVGLGPVGQLTARLYQMAGAFVVGWDTVALRREIAQQWGIDATVAVGADDVVAATRAFTRGYGLDAAVIAYGGEANQTVEDLEKSMKRSPDGHPMGRLVMVGQPHFEFKSTLTNLDYRRAARTGAGYHDEDWEFGAPYPSVFMRWTTRTNLELCMRLIAAGKVNVDVLTTHRIPLADVEAGIDAIIDDPDSILGVVLESP